MPLILLNKPYRVLSQFRDKAERTTLANFIEVANVYPAGRLDYESEGLLLLTDDGQLQARISSPNQAIRKCYWCQVDGLAAPSQLERLVNGVNLKDGAASAEYAKTVAEPDQLWARQPPIRFRKSLPTQWLDIAITEGRNRQVRRMTAAVELPTLRLIRHAIGPWHLDSLKPGESRTIDVRTAWRELQSYVDDAR